MVQKHYFAFLPVQESWSLQILADIYYIFIVGMSGAQDIVHGQCLPDKHEALSWIPGTIKKKVVRMSAPYILRVFHSASNKKSPKHLAFNIICNYCCYNLLSVIFVFFLNFWQCYVCCFSFFFLFFSVVVRIESRTLHILGKLFPTKIHPKSILILFNYSGIFPQLSEIKFYQNPLGVTYPILLFKT